mmetsp:Transcript_86457/g.239744  ORF Transcript_86457/g.239744 Transcript_86457/m.239744 type:complete len:301 (-) Transcript_86457:147-1049(-)
MEDGWSLEPGRPDEEDWLNLDLQNGGDREGFYLQGCGDMTGVADLADSVFDSLMGHKSSDIPSTAYGDDLEPAPGQPPLPKWADLPFPGESKGAPAEAERASGMTASSGWQSSTFSSASFLDVETPPNIIVGTRTQPQAVNLSLLSWCPRLPDGHFMSLGSRLHDTGHCTPCKFFRGRRGCRDQALCQLCHYPHEELTRSGVRRAQKRSSIEKRKLFEDNSALLIPPSVMQGTMRTGPSGAAPEARMPSGTQAPMPPTTTLPRAFSCHDLGFHFQGLPSAYQDLPASFEDGVPRHWLLRL